MKLTKNQIAHLKTIGTIISSVIGVFVLLLGIALFPNEVIAIISCVGISIMIYMSYNVVYNIFRNKQK